MFSDIDSNGGVIRKEYSIECATCPDLETLHAESLHAAEKLARLHGWSETDQFGWICAECVARRKSGGRLGIWKYREPEETRGDSSVGRAD